MHSPVLLAKRYKRCVTDRLQFQCNEKWKPFSGHNGDQLSLRYDSLYLNPRQFKSVYPQFRTSFECRSSEPFYIIIVQQKLRGHNNTLWCLHHLLVEKWWWWFAQGDEKTSYHSTKFSPKFIENRTIFVILNNQAQCSRLGIDTFWILHFLSM